MYEQTEDTQDFFKEDAFDANWFDKVDDLLSKKVILSGDKIKEFENTGSSWWTLYKFNNTYYVGLCDFEDIWEVNEEELIEKCII